MILKYLSCVLQIEIPVTLSMPESIYSVKQLPALLGPRRPKSNLELQFPDFVPLYRPTTTTEPPPTSNGAQSFYTIDLKHRLAKSHVGNVIRQFFEKEPRLTILGYTFYCRSYSPFGPAAVSHSPSSLETAYLASDEHTNEEEEAK